MRELVHSWHLLVYICTEVHRRIRVTPDVLKSLSVVFAVFGEIVAWLDLVFMPSHFEAEGAKR